MKLGFIGTGAITEALVRGFCATANGPTRILLSPRNAQRSATLARSFDRVETAESNQAVVDGSEVVCLAVRPDIARAVVGELRFRPNQTAVSLLPTFSLDHIADLVAPAANVCRVLPLPPAARREGPIAIYPRGHALAPLFALVGTVVELKSEEEFAALLASTSLMASFFAAEGEIAQWLTAKGVGAQAARRYVAELAAALANTARDDSLSYAELVTEHTTPQGLNAQSLRELRTAGVCESINRTLDLIERRTRGLATFEDTLEAKKQ